MHWDRQICDLCVRPCATETYHLSLFSAGVLCVSLLLPLLPTHSCVTHSCVTCVFYFQVLAKNKSNIDALAMMGWLALCFPDLADEKNDSKGDAKDRSSGQFLFPFPFALLCFGLLCLLCFLVFLSYWRAVEGRR